MTKALLSTHKANVISNGVFVASLGILYYSETWWPGILLALLTTLLVRQYFTGRHWDAAISIFILGGLFTVIMLNVTWEVLITILFVVGGIYIIFKECYFAEDTNGKEKSEEIREDADLDKE